MRATLRTRRAFTLLEMLLALAIGVMLLTAVYFALDIYIQSTQAGRQQVDQAAISRAVVKKIQHDISANLIALPPPPTPTKPGKAATTATGAASTAATAAASGGVGPFPFNLGVYGDQNTLTLFVSKVSVSNSTMTTDGSTPATDQAIDSDLRRITYWVIADGDVGKGLARQEVVMVTSDDQMNNMPPDIADADTFIFAPEVLAATFEYFDGTTWQQDWDGTTSLGPQGSPLPGTGQVAVGPPLAIRITLKIGRTDAKTTDPNDPDVMTFEHVIHIPSSNAGANIAANNAASAGG
jgi:prepilin-type N-terminal cleavage/methylation domain-containing protein